MSAKVCADQGKHMYPGQLAAIRAALSYSKKRGTALRPYYHHACRSWHLSKRPLIDTNNERRAS